MKKKIIIAIIVLVIVVVVLVIVKQKSSQKSKNGLKTEEVKKGNVIVKALAIGQIVPRQEISIKSKISGIVKKKMAQVGDYVTRGQTLIEIDPDPTPIEYTQAKRNVEFSEISLRKAELEYKRSQELKNKNLISQQEFESFQNSFDEQKLNFQLETEKFDLLSTGKIELAGKKIENTIKSPIDGTILEYFVNDGDPVVPLTTYQAGTSLMIIADMKDLIFKGTVDEIDIGKIKIRTPVNLKIGALPNSKIEGMVSRISPKAKKEGNTTLFDIEIAITRSDSNVVLRAGLSANAEIIVARADSVIVVSERLITYSGDTAFVEIKKGQNAKEFEKRRIKTKLSDGMITEIDSGLVEHEMVIERPPKEIK